MLQLPRSAERAIHRRHDSRYSQEPVRIVGRNGCSAQCRSV